MSDSVLAIRVYKDAREGEYVGGVCVPSERLRSLVTEGAGTNWASTTITFVDGNEEIAEERFNGGHYTVKVLMTVPPPIVVQGSEGPADV